MITVVDYGMGNLGSVKNMLKKIGMAVEVSGEFEAISKARKLLLPGVGAFDAAMERINQSGLRDVLTRKALDEKVPILGICLGMQLLTQGSEEGELPGLGWIDALTRRFPSNPRYKVPHMGWNTVSVVRPSSLIEGMRPDSRFYFVHSYYVTVHDEKDAVLKAEHGVVFDAVVQRANVFGAQFHPEKSHKFGMKILENFANL